MRTRVVLLALLLGCATPAPRVVVDPLAGGLEPFLVAHPLASGQGVRVDEIQRSPSASWFVVQVRTGEPPHRHLTHDLTVTMLRGHGTLTLEGRRIPLRAGDVAVVPRGTAHFFTNGDRTPSVTFAVFTPVLDAPDTVPLVDSRSDRR